MSNDLPIFPTSSLDDDTISSSSSYEDPPSTAVTIALTPPQPQPQPTLAPNPTPPQPPTDPPRLFQRLWTDEDELALLKGFRDFTATHAPTSAGHYHDTAPFYDHIKSVLQPHFNKSQLVEKLRRLKKKYRTNLSKIRSGMDFVFKSNHDQALFDISRDIWFNLPDRFYDDDSTPAPAPTPFPIPITIASPSPITIARPVNSSFVMSQVDLTGFSGNGGGGGGGGGGLPKLCTRKRSRGANAEKVGVVEGVENVNVNVNVNASNVGVGSSLQGLVEETVKNCLSPVLKDVVEDVVRSVGFKGGSVDERWRKQQVMELEVYSKRLELVQEQIKLSLEELRSVES